MPTLRKKINGPSTHGSVQGYHYTSRPSRRRVVGIRTTVPPNHSFDNPPHLEVETYLRRPRPSTTIHDCVVTVGRDIFLVSAYWDKSRDAPINRSVLNATGVHWRGEAIVVGIGRVVPYLKHVRNAWDAEAALLKFLQAFKARRADKKRPPRSVF